MAQRHPVAKATPCHWLAWVAFALAACSAPALALDPQRPFKQYAHERWSVEEGLPFPGGYELAQDGEGHLWLGSLSGLSRFDGQRFVVFDSETTPVLGSNLVYGLHTDDLGRLWVGTEQGATIYHRGNFTSVPALRGSLVRVLGMDRGLMLVSNSEAVLGLDEGLKIRVRYPVPRASAFGRRGQELWFSTDNPVYRLHQGRLETVELPGLEQGFVEAFVNSAGRLWAQSTSGLYFHDGSGWQLHDDPRLRNRVISMAPDRDGNFWVGTELRLLRLRDNQVVEETELGPFAKAPRKLFEDRDGSLWLASHAAGLHRFWNGVARITPLHIPPEEAQYIWAVVPWQGEIMVGGTFGLAVTRNGVLEQVPGTSQLPQVYSLAKDGGTLLVGTIRGVYRYYANGRLEAPQELAELKDTRSNSFLRDRRGRLWIGTSRGLYRLDLDGPLRRLTGTDNSTRWETRKLLQTRDGRVFAASSAGLVQVVEDQVRTVQLPEPGMIVMAVHETADGQLLIGSKSSGKLYLQHQDNWIALGRQRGVPTNDVYAIVPDDQGNLLVSGVRGAYLFPEYQLGQVAEDPEATLRVQGLLTLSRNYAPGQEAVCCLGGGDGRGYYADGHFFLPVSEGFFTLTPPATVQATSTPRIQRLATGRRAEISGQALTVPGLRLEPEERDLQFEFTSISLQPMHAPRLQYRLHGYDRQWRELGNRMQPRVQYTNLPPGRYRFEVIDAAAAEPRQAATTEFQIAPYFHETLAFKAVVAALGVLCLLGALRLNSQRHLRHKRRLEEEVNARTGELRHAYDRLESISRTDALTGINNRRHAAEEIPARLARLQRLRMDVASGREHKVAVFALMDIDHFKSINDSWGHHVGDLVLQEIARRLHQQVRAGDCLARWGGEEFLLVCFELDAGQYTRIGERLCASIRDRPFQVEDHTLQITVSVGLARVGHGSDHALGADWEQIVRTADRALYMAKDRGRDCWVMLDVWEQAQPAASPSEA
jgi:diguanylate cyclase (GGDEF)-like protein